MLTGQTYHIEHFINLIAAFGLIGIQLIDFNALANNLLDRHARIQAGNGILKDHLHLAGHLTGFFRVQLAVDALAVKPDFAARRLIQADDGASGRRLAAAGFTDQTDRFALLNIEGNIVHCLHRRLVLAQIEVFAEVFDLKNVFAHGLTSLASCAAIRLLSGSGMPIFGASGCSSQVAA